MTTLVRLVQRPEDGFHGRRASSIRAAGVSRGFSLSRDGELHLFSDDNKLAEMLCILNDALAALEGQGSVKTLAVEDRTDGAAMSYVAGDCQGSFVGSRQEGDACSWCQCGIIDEIVWIVCRNTAESPAVRVSCMSICVSKQAI